MKESLKTFQKKSTKSAFRMIFLFQRCPIVTPKPAAFTQIKVGMTYFRGLGEQEFLQIETGSKGASPR
jgi:hypothetical protein